MQVSIARNPITDQCKPAAADVLRAVGGAVTRSRNTLVTSWPLAMTPGSQYSEVRQIALNVLAGCCEVDGFMTVRDLYALLDREGGSR